MENKKFVFYANGEIELVSYDNEHPGTILNYIAHWNSKAELLNNMGLNNFNELKELLEAI